MVYSLAITIAAGLLLLALFGGATLLARRAAGGVGPVRGWRWYPSPLGLLILLPVAAFLVLRLAPAILLIPIIVPFFWRSRRLAGPLLFLWNLGRRRSPGDGDDGSIEGQYRPVDES